jgi:hypothetical protein
VTADVGGLLRRVDELYESVVTTPDRWNDLALSEWAQDVAGEQALPKEVSRHLRRCLRLAQKLRDFWSAPPPSPPEEWRARVDVALGSRAWRPTLDLAKLGLELAPTEELYVEVRARFRVVHSDRWMEGVGFEEWLARQGLEPPSTGSANR